MDEIKLVQKLKAGDKSAFDALYEKYKNTLLRMAYLVSGNMADAEDIVQETFVKCYVHIGELKKPEGFKSWLFQILYRTAYSHGKKRRREIPSEDIDIQADAVSRDTPLDRIIESEVEKAVKDAVWSLGFKHRAVVVMYYYNEMSTKEIAGILACTEGTVKSRLFMARKKLKGILEQNGGKSNEKVHELYFL